MSVALSAISYFSAIFPFLLIAIILVVQKLNLVAQVSCTGELGGGGGGGGGEWVDRILYLLFSQSSSSMQQ